METNGVPVSPHITSFSVSISIPGTSSVIHRFGKQFNCPMSRYGGYSSPGWGHGVRTIVFNSTAPLDGLETYILMENGTSHARVVLDEHYV